MTEVDGLRLQTSAKSSTGYRGVRQRGKKYEAHFRGRYLGSFDKAVDAAVEIARRAAPNFAHEIGRRAPPEALADDEAEAEEAEEAEAMTADEALRRAAAKGLVLERSDACESGFVGVTRRAAARGRKEFCAEVIPDVWFQTAEEAALRTRWRSRRSAAPARRPAGGPPVPPRRPRRAAAAARARAARAARAGGAAPRPLPPAPAAPLAPPDSADIVAARERVAERSEPGFAEQLSRGFAEKIREHESARATTRRARAAAPHAGRPAGVCTYSSILNSHAQHTTLM